MNSSDDPERPYQAVVRLPGGNLSHRSVCFVLPPRGKISVWNDGAGTFYIDCEKEDDAVEYMVLAHCGLFCR